MNIIDRSALKIANSIRFHYPDAASEAVLFYSLSLIINTLTAVGISLMICTITGHLAEALIVILFYFLLRYVSGGAHMSSSVSCCILSIIILATLPHVKFNYWFGGMIIDILSIVILLLKAPDGIEKVSRIDPKYYPLLKIISVCIVASNFYFQYSFLSAAFITQAFFITGFAYKSIHILERRLKI